MAPGGGEPLGARARLGAGDCPGHTHTQVRQEKQAGRELSSRKFLTLRVSPDIEKKLLFLTQQVPEAD